MSFYKVTTPTNTFVLPFDTSECSVIQITYTQKKKQLKKQYENGQLPAGVTLDEKNVIVNLTQEETKCFEVGTVEAQVRVLTTGGKAYASKSFKIGVMKVNNEEVLK